MSKVLMSSLAFALLVLTGCSKSAPQPAPNAAVQSSPSATPVTSSSAMAVAPTLATPPSAPMPLPANGKEAPKNLPNVIGDRLYRALTLEEINQLPPETRDAILRAQGRPPASPAPKKK